MCQAGATQAPPDRDAVRPDSTPPDPMPRAQFGHQLIQRQVAFFLDPAFNPTRDPRQLAKTAAIALGLRLKRPGCALQKHHVVHQLDRNAKPHCAAPT